MSKKTPVRPKAKRRKTRSKRLSSPKIIAQADAAHFNTFDSWPMDDGNLS